MTDNKNESEADLRSASLGGKKDDPSYDLNDFTQNENSRLGDADDVKEESEFLQPRVVKTLHLADNNDLPPNGFLFRSSRFLRREDRDLRLVLSPRHEDFLVHRDDLDLIERLRVRFEPEPIFDPILEENPETRRLFSLKTSKERENQEKTRELIGICSRFGLLVKDAPFAIDPSIRELFDRCERLKEEISEIDQQVGYLQQRDVEVQKWPEPVPFKDDLFPVPLFDLSMLPPPLQRYVEDSAERMQGPSEFIMAALLASISSIIGAGCAIRPFANDSWAVVPNLWGALVGSPGSKKSPAMVAGLALISALEEEADREYEALKVQREIDKLEHEARKKYLKKNLDGAIDRENEHEIEAAKAALGNLEAGQMKAPAWKRYKSSDATIEKLEELLAENPRGLLVYRDELIGFFASLEREGREGSRAFYLEAWNGHAPASVKTDRIGRGTTACNPCLSVFGSIQPERLRRYLQETASGVGNDGLIQRFQLLVYPDRLTKWDLIDRKPDSTAKDRVVRIARILAHSDFLSMGAAHVEGFDLPVFHFDDEAQLFFNDWLRILENRLRSDPELEEGLLAEHLAKYRSLMPSLALLFYLVRVADEAAPGKVPFEDAKRAADCCLFLEAHARRVYRMLDNRGVHIAKVLLRKLQEGALNEEFGVRDIYRKGWSGLSNIREVEDACEELVLKGWIRREEVLPSTQGGPTTMRYRKHPDLVKRADKTSKI